MNNNLEKLAKSINKAEAIVVFAGSKMNSTSHLPALRNQDDLWNNYITIAGNEVDYFDLFTPKAFLDKPDEAWGIIAYLIDLYKQTEPHRGYHILKKFLFKKEYFIITSNIDQQFIKAGFDKEKIYEINGSLFNSQCNVNINCGIWETCKIEYDLKELKALKPYPFCPICKNSCRPNTLLFKDDSFVNSISQKQQIVFFQWKGKILNTCSKIIALEIGVTRSETSLKSLSKEFTKQKYQLFKINSEDDETDIEKIVSIDGPALKTFKFLQKRKDTRIKKRKYRKQVLYNYNEEWERNNGFILDDLPF